MRPGGRQGRGYGAGRRVPPGRETRLRPGHHRQAAGCAGHAERDEPVRQALQEVVERSLAVQSGTVFDGGHFRTGHRASASAGHSDALFQPVASCRLFDEVAV